MCSSLITSHGSGSLKFKIWLEQQIEPYIELDWLGTSWARFINDPGSNKLELIRFFDSSNPQFYCITSVTMIDATYLNMFSQLQSTRIDAFRWFFNKKKNWKSFRENFKFWLFFKITSQNCGLAELARAFWKFWLEPINEPKLELHTLLEV